MSQTVTTPLDRVGRSQLHSPWVLVLGGVSRDGNRRARRATRNAVAEGLTVVWIDAYEETFDDDPSTRVPVDGLEGEGSLLIVPFRGEERSGLINRLAYGNERKSSGNGDEPSPSTSGSLASRLRRRFFHKVNLAIRGYLMWLRLKPQVRRLAREAQQPRQIVYCDDYTIPTAWHCVRMWPEARADMEFIVG